MAYLWSVLAAIPTPVATMFGIMFATVGWLYGARRNRNLSRKQHTFNALLQASFNDRYHKELGVMRPHFRKGVLPDIKKRDEEDTLRDSLVFILNHYEFLAAGIRNGDISEKLLRDSERGTVIKIFEVSHKYIATVREERNRATHFEHLEWLFVRWKEKPPSLLQCVVERVLARPLYHDRHRWAALTIAVIAALAVLIVILHLPGEPFNSPVPR